MTTTPNLLNAALHRVRLENPGLTRQAARHLVQQRNKDARCRPNPSTRTLVIAINKDGPVRRVFFLGRTSSEKLPLPNCAYQRKLLASI